MLEAGHGLASRVVCADTVLHLFGEAWQQTEVRIDDLDVRHSFVT